MLPAIAASIFGGFATFVVARIASGTTGDKNGAAPVVVRPPVQRPPAGAPAPLPVPEPPPEPIEVAPPPPPPPPPVDSAPELPTPPAPPPIVAPPVIAPPIVYPVPAPPRPAPPAPPVVVAPPPVIVPAPLPVPEPPPEPIEVAPPPPPPPPLDSAPELPTPPAPAPVNPPSAGPAGEPAVPSSPPAGFDPSKAAQLAGPMAAQLTSKKYDYARAQLKAFQRAAGVTQDGIYGNDTWGALLYYTSSAPKALFKPTTPTPYPWAYMAQATVAPVIKVGPAQVSPAPSIAPAPPAPPIPELPPLPEPPPDSAPLASAPSSPQPPAGFNPTSARKLAKQVAAQLDSKGRNYSVVLLKQFQTAAGIAADGLYGGGSRGALIAYGITRPPAPMFKPTTTTPYPWQDRL